MSGLIAFTKKEFLEQLRSFKALILLAVLFLFGMMSPLLAKMLPDILSGMTVQGMSIVIPSATVFDAWSQFFKNIGQLGLVVLLILFSGLLSQDISKGTLIVLLAKGLSRHAVLAAKFVSALIVWSVGYGLAAVTAWGYTVYLFGSGGAPNLLLALFCLWLFGVFILALLLFASAAVPGSYGGLLTAAGLLIALIILNAFPVLQKYNPAALASGNAGLLNGQLQSSDMTAAVWITAGLVAALLLLAAALFRKRRL